MKLVNCVRGIFRIFKKKLYHCQSMSSRLHRPIKLYDHVPDILTFVWRRWTIDKTLLASLECQLERYR